MLRRLPLQFEHLQHVISDAVQLGEWLHLFKQPTKWELNQEELCSICRVQVEQIRSKQRETYGQTFVKCPYSVKVSDFVSIF
jgi:hypothetical protein